jgi:hypothetical protein
MLREVEVKSWPLFLFNMYTIHLDLLGTIHNSTCIAVIFNQHDHLTLSDISAAITTFTDDEKCPPD